MLLTCTSAVRSVITNASAMERLLYPRAIKAIAGAVFMAIVVGLLAVTTERYVPAVIFGAIFGAVLGWMFGSWPPGPSDDVTSGGE